jgi:hypothetical protein
VLVKKMIVNLNKKKRINKIRFFNEGKLN